MTIHYSKLVRDKVIDLIRKRGGKVIYHSAGSDEEYWHKLKEKLQEELDEFAQTETVENLVDVLEVIDAVCDFKKFDRKELNAVKENRAIERGKFTKRIILESSSEQVGMEADQLL